jgi:starvation-inducible outer membrane lipoprotein
MKKFFLYTLCFFLSACVTTDYKNNKKFQSFASKTTDLFIHPKDKVNTSIADKNHRILAEKIKALRQAMGQ